MKKNSKNIGVVDIFCRIRTFSKHSLLFKQITSLVEVIKLCAYVVQLSMKAEFQIAQRKLKSLGQGWGNLSIFSAICRNIKQILPNDKFGGPELAREI